MSNNSFINQDRMDLQRLSEAEYAYEFPAKLLGLTVEDLHSRPLKEQLDIAVRLQRISHQTALARALLLAGIVITEDIRPATTNAGRAFQAIDGRYWPTSNTRQALNMLFFIENQAIDLSGTLSILHYNAIVKLFKVKHADKLPEVGITPQKVVYWAAETNKTIDFIKKFAKQMAKIMETLQEKAVDKTEEVRKFIAEVWDRVGET